MLSGYFNIESLLDVILVPTWLHFGFQNPPKSCLGSVLGPLGRLWEDLRSQVGRVFRRDAERRGTRRPRDAGMVAAEPPPNQGQGTHVKKSARGLRGDL